MYVMHTKLTLRLDEQLIERAKDEAERRGKSVSQMVAEFFSSLDRRSRREQGPRPPITGSLLGLLRGTRVDERDYKRHLATKYL